MIKKILHLIRRDGLWYTIKRATAFAMARTPLGSHLSFPYYHHTRLTFSPALLTYQLFANHLTRSTDVAVFEKFIQSGDIVIDVGANIGSLTIPAAYHVGPTGTVLAIEPSPKFADIIRGNISLNHYTDRVSVHEVALGDCSATVYLNEALADDTTNHISSSGTPVTQITLDSLTANLTHIDFLKIDVEGYELHVLKGAKETLPKTKRIYIEFIPELLMRSGTTPESVLDILQTHFDLFTIDASQKLMPFSFNPSNTTYADLLGLNRAYDLPH